MKVNLENHPKAEDFQLEERLARAKDLNKKKEVLEAKLGGITVTKVE